MFKRLLQMVRKLNLRGVTQMNPWIQRTKWTSIVQLQWPRRAILNFAI
uniref:Uncharacterized protein n=1 Tax=Arundo donax TaxID=35708 RepID=A0A0A9CXN5_ARUDO